MDIYNLKVLSSKLKGQGEGGGPVGWYQAWQEWLADIIAWQKFPHLDVNLNSNPWNQSHQLQRGGVKEGGGAHFLWATFNFYPEQDLEFYDSGPRYCILGSDCHHPDTYQAVGKHVTSTLVLNKLGSDCHHPDTVTWLQATRLPGSRYWTY